MSRTLFYRDQITALETLDLLLPWRTSRVSLYKPAINVLSGRRLMCFHNTVIKLTLIVFSFCSQTLAQSNEATSTLIAEEPIVLSAHFHYSKFQSYDENWPVEVAACEMTNVCIVDATIGADLEKSTKAINVLLASGEIPDIVGASPIKDIANQFGPRGAFLPLNSLIDKHAPHIKSLLQDRPILRDSISAADGNIYHIPYLPDGKFARVYWIRTDWLESLNLAMPETIEEFEEVLVAFRDRDPNGNGLKDEIPFFARHWQEYIRLVTLFGGRSTGTDLYHDFVHTDRKISHPYIQDGYRDGIHHLARWYREGLVDPEIFTRGEKSREQLLSRNVGGATRDWMPSTSTFNNLSSEIEGFEFRVMSPPANVNGIRFEENRRSQVKASGWAIGALTDKPIETMKYFDFSFSPEGRRLANFGIEGEQYDLIDGEPIFKPEFLAQGPVNDQLHAIGAQMMVRGFPQDHSYEVQWSNQIALEGIALYEQGDYLIEEFPGVSFNEEEQRTYDKLWWQIRSYMLKRQKEWILGEGEIMTDWEDYLLELEQMQLDTVLSAVQSAFDRQYSRK